MTKKIYRSIVLVSFLTFILTTALIMGFLYEYFNRISEEQLVNETEIAAEAINSMHGDEESMHSYLEKIGSSDKFRITIIAQNGDVIYDNEADITKMENHSNRPEFKQAKSHGFGKARRSSKSLMTVQNYYAIELSNKDVLRLSVQVHTVLSLLLGMIQPLIFIGIAIVIIALLMAMSISKRIVEPLNEIDMDLPFDSDAYEEIGPLLERIRDQRERMDYQEDELLKKRNEINMIFEHMNEGIILLDDKNMIININARAEKIMHSSDSIGKNIIEINRTMDLQNAIKDVKDYKEEKSLVINIDDLIYKVSISRIIHDGKFEGLELMFLDITEQEEAQEIRREFTANVSHELKTPVHILSGYSELLKNGMVSPGDIPEIAEKINEETAHMSRLIQDITELSALDEGGSGGHIEEIDLHDVSEHLAREYRGYADEHDVILNFSGIPAIIHGRYNLVEEIIKNLIENAIKYNNPGGHVFVETGIDDEHPFVKVTDDGIGIPEADQQRVFERFYRVDKSHSGKRKGTGLGLSIVKHASEEMHASITLKSQPKKGTEITVTFPDLV